MKEVKKMKNQLSQKSPISINNDIEIRTEDFSEIHVLVEGLLASLKNKPKQKKSPSNKKWKKKPAKTKKNNYIGIRELPFTF